MSNLEGATYLCRNCKVIFVIGPLTLGYAKVFTCPGCSSTNIEYRPDLRPLIQIDNTGHYLARGDAA